MKKHVKDYFVPHSGNDYRPHGLQKAAMGGMSVLVLLSFALTSAQSIFWVQSDWLLGAILPAVVTELTNDERVDGDLSPLRRNAVLDAAATLKAQHMAQNEYFAHYAPDGTSPWYFFGQVDYNFVHAGENLAIHFNDSSDVVDAWMDSPTHRANIMNGQYSEIGIGTAEGEFEGYKTVYVVQLFGTPAATPTPAPVPTPVPEPIVVAEAEVVPVPVTEPIAEVPIIVTEPEPEPEPVAAPVIVTAAEDTVENEEVLAEAVDVIETVEVIPAEPEAVLVETDVATETLAVAEIEDSFISTSTGGVSATIGADTDQAQPQISFFAELATQPHLVLQILYAVIGLFVIASLLIALVIEIEKQHPVQIAYSVALLLCMYGLYNLHIALTSTVAIV